MVIVFALVAVCSMIFIAVQARRTLMPTVQDGATLRPEPDGSFLFAGKGSFDVGPLSAATAFLKVRIASDHIGVRNGVVPANLPDVRSYRKTDNLTVVLVGRSARRADGLRLVDSRGSVQIQLRGADRRAIANALVAHGWPYERAWS